ncbi:serine O-acetyltransferase [Vibrio renipiscarius]|uniref:serine O-acetyltransferase n=1 Tax=Vibrio renipiscarius TaxID=1461322 RepID=UPI000699C9A3|nr:DapH/DapD/GlmU-related protein [Vibrio renipiscarius]
MAKKITSNIINYLLFVIFYRSFTRYASNDFSIGVKQLCIQQIHLPHPIGIVIGKGVLLGKNCVIYQGVTIGKSNAHSDFYPVIGSNVTIYTGAVIIGNINIGDNCVIGAGRVVSRSLEAGTILKCLSD